MKSYDGVRTPHDEWGKRAFSVWLDGLGDVLLDARIGGESRRGDVLYTERKAVPSRRRSLGVLGDLARGRVLFEIFRKPPTVLDLLSCVVKAIELRAREAREARRNKTSISSVEGPTLCVLTPSMSKGYAADAGATEMSGVTSGLYTLSSIFRTVIVVVHELPSDRSTLWLRLLGRGSVQTGAVEELCTMSRREPLVDGTIELLVAWRQSLPTGTKISEDDQEVRMNLERVYERWERKVKAQAHREGLNQGLSKGLSKGRTEGRTEGRIEGKAEAVLAVLEGRGLRVTAAQRKQVLGCTDGEVLDAWLRAAGTAPDVKTLLSAGGQRRARAKSGT